MSRHSWKARPIPPILLKTFFFILFFLLVGLVLMRLQDSEPKVHNYESCVSAGNPVLEESPPKQCVYQGKSYIDPSQNIPKPY